MGLIGRLFLLFVLGLRFSLFAAHPEYAARGMVVSAKELASNAGSEILCKGGNAVDAAVATAFALAVVFPMAGNIGGGGFMMIRTADGDIHCLNFRESAPGAATANMFLDENGEPIPDASTLGGLAVAVPGTPAGLLAAHQRFGRLSRAKVMEPAIRLATEGYQLSYLQARRFNNYREIFQQYEGSAKYFIPATGKWQIGDLFVQKDLGETLKKLRDEGARVFYRGEIAKKIVKTVQKYDGILTLEDLAHYYPIWEKPLKTDYKGYTVYSTPPPSSGGVTLIQMLEMLEDYNLRKMGKYSSETIHLLGEVMRRGAADRVKFIGDPDYLDVPTKGLTDPAYARDRMADFDPDRVTPSDQLGAGNPKDFEHEDTTHFSVVDAEGNAVSCTYTINGAFGSKMAVMGGGFMLNNEMDDFAIRPGIPNQYGVVGSETNKVGPGKRMVSSIAPTIVTKNDELYMAIGAPGGAQIPNIILQVLVNVIDFRMNIQDAIDYPRIHHQWKPDLLYHEGKIMPRDLRDNLEARGWKTKRAKYGRIGQANGVLVKDEILQGGADRRQENKAVGH